MQVSTLMREASGGGAKPLAVLCTTLSPRVTAAAATPPAKLTPYQGSKRSFGFYRCTVCPRSWQSAYSWANCSQDCKSCQGAV
jgi:hypothetical protein